MPRTLGRSLHRHASRGDPLAKGGAGMADSPVTRSGTLPHHPALRIRIHPLFVPPLPLSPSPAPAPSPSANSLPQPAPPPPPPPCRATCCRRRRRSTACPNCRERPMPSPAPSPTSSRAWCPIAAPALPRKSASSKWASAPTRRCSTLTISTTVTGSNTPPLMPSRRPRAKR